MFAVIKTGGKQYKVAANDVLKIDNYLGLHPNLAPLKELFDDGRMGIVQGVGYPNPNRSHFRSTDIWESGIPDKEIVTSGWIGLGPKTAEFEKNFAEYVGAPYAVGLNSATACQAAWKFA